MSARTLKAKGFTLVEILIVVVILGILAAIVIPQFTSASESAKKSSMQTQLQSLRSQLELYQLQHNGNYPGANAANTGLVSAADFWSDLTETTAPDGTASTAAGALGPYLQKEVKNSFENNSTTIVADVAGDVDTGAAAGVGFVYDPTDGEIKFVMSAAKATELNMLVADGDVLTY